MVYANNMDQNQAHIVLYSGFIFALNIFFVTKTKQVHDHFYTNRSYLDSDVFNFINVNTIFQILVNLNC